ncbi:MAG: PfkB family carbohydrate kinase [Eubacteriales bacterium]|nr:PfkB family carbohydrate kinase [Eubacteriales bacterium]
MTITDIAKMAGVSIATVSKIINGKDEHVNPNTRARVLQLVKEYNFTPYGAVKNTLGPKKFLLGVLLRSTVKSSLLLNSILETAQEHGYGVLLLESQGDCVREAKNITIFCKNNVDGVIWEPISDNSYERSQDLTKYMIPFCFINSPLQYPSYEIDYASLGYTLTQKLIDKKHTNIACLLKKGSIRSIPFVKGLRKCLYNNQLPYSDDMIFYTCDDSFIPKMLQYNITGAVSTHFDNALSLYETLNKQRYFIPSDFSIISLRGGCYDVSSHPPVSSVTIPYEEFGHHVCSEFIKICEKALEGDPSYQFSPSWELNHEKSISQPSYMKKKMFISVGSIHKDNTFNVSMMPQLGNTLKIHNSATSIGGKGANQAIGIAKLGHPVSLICAVGNDIDGTFVLNALEKENVSTQGILRNKNNQTGTAFIYTKSDGESAITILGGANDELVPADIENSSHLFRNACFCLISSEIPLETVIATARIAKENNVTTIFKPTVLEKMPEELYETIDILIPNRKEASVLCPEYASVEQQADYFFRRGIPTVIITLGHEGCYLKTKDTMQYFSASHWSAVDTTGGADAFISALASYLYEGYSLEKAIQIAMIAAGFCVSRQGVSSALIDHNSLEVYITKNKPYLLRPDSSKS